MKKYIFYAQTSAGYVIKGIFEILLECLTTDVPLKIEESGITTCCIDKENRQLVQLDLPMGNFDKKYMCKKTRSVSIHLKTFCKNIKNVKKKDTLTLFLEEDNPNKLGIQITPPINANTDANDGKETSYIKVHDVICPKIAIPKGYNYPKNMKSVAYQKMCKKMGTLDQKTVQVKMQKNNYVGFTGTTDLISSCIDSGEIDDADDTPLYEAVFNIDSLTQFTKISTLSSTIKLYAPEDERFPLKIEAQTSLGSFTAFIKTEAQIEAQKEAQNNIKKAKVAPARSKEEVAEE